MFGRSKVVFVVLASAGLSFLSFGVQLPTPKCGLMLTDGRTYIRSAPYLIIFPGLTVMAAVLAFNYLGDALKDMLDSRKKRNSDM